MPRVRAEPPRQRLAKTPLLCLLFHTLNKQDQSGIIALRRSTVGLSEAPCFTVFALLAVEDMNITGTLILGALLAGPESLSIAQNALNTLRPNHLRVARVVARST